MRWFRSNGLTTVFFLLFLVAISGQTLTGLKEYNNELEEKGGASVSLGGYLSSGHFIETTFENWESEFLQMALFVVLTIFLYQRGSSESKDPDGGKEEVEEEPDPKKKGAPWPVRKGGWTLKLYKHSLSIALFALFLLSFLAHFYGSLKDYNQLQFLAHKPLVSATVYLGNSRFWFESFQNWQSEFLSVFAIILLSVYLRQIGSPQSKPVDAPHRKTGD